jgi:tyrosine-protein phosphatase YwqE
MMSLFGKLFGRNKFELPDFSVFRTDMHSHLIPGIDDGSKSLDQSIELIRGLRELGFEKIITTPHIMAGGYDNSSEIILEGLKKVKERLKEEGIQMEFEAAAEYYMDENFERLIENDDLLTFGDNYVLFELSYLTEQQSFNEIVFKLNSKGYKPVLAHPERYPYYYSKNGGKFEQIHERGVFFQINLMSLIGKYGPGAREAGRQLIEKDLVRFVGTDLHNPGHLVELQRVLKEKALEKLSEDEYLLNQKL